MTESFSQREIEDAKKQYCMNLISHTNRKFRFDEKIDEKDLLELSIFCPETIECINDCF